MSTETPPVAVDTPPSQDYSRSDVASRHAGLFKNNEVVTSEENSLEHGTDLSAIAAKDLEGKNGAPPKEKETKAKSETDIPDEILGIERKAKKNKEEEDLLTQEPKGQLKNENYKKLQTHAKERIEKEVAARLALEKDFNDYKGRFKEDGLPEKYAKEREELLKGLKERDDLIGRKYVEESPSFRERFTSKQAGIVAQLKKAGEEFGIDNATALLGLSAKKRAEALEDRTPAEAAYISSLLQQHDQVEGDKAEYLKDWEGKKGAMELEERAKSDAEKARLKEHEDGVFKSAVEHAAKTYAPYREIEGNENWNKGRAADIETAKRFFDGNFTTEEYAELALAGAAMPRMHAMYQRVVELYKEARAEADSLKAAGPDINGGGAKPNPNEGMDSTRFNRNDAQRAFRMIAGAARENEVA